MSRRRSKSKRRPVPIPIASMGDIAFLLIIFFMVLSEFAKDRDLNLELPDSAQVEEPAFPAAARVSVDADGQIFFDGEPLESATEVEYAVRAVLTNTESDDQRRVEFKADGELRDSQFVPVIKAVAEGGGIIEAVAEPTGEAKRN